MLETVLWAIVFMGLGALIVVFVGIAILLISSDK